MPLCKSIAWLRQIKTNTSDDEECLIQEKLNLGTVKVQVNPSPVPLVKLRTKKNLINVLLRLNCVEFQRQKVGPLWIKNGPV